MSTVPGRYMANIERDACGSGCEPRPAQWNTAFEEVIKKVIQDGAQYTGINDPDAQAAFTTYLNDVYQDILNRCGDRLGDDHLCSDGPKNNALEQCVDNNAKSAALSSSRQLWSHITEDRCEMVSDYLKSDQLWNKDLPARGKVYVQSCKEL